MSSLEFCQHEGDQGVSHSTNPSTQMTFSALGGVNAQASYAVHPFLGNMLGTGGPTISPALFATLETTEDVHHVVFRSLAQIMGDRMTTESITKYYFATINSWFSVVERARFDEQLEKMWSEPSADTGLLALCMLLVVRSPEESQTVSMQNSLYYSVKTLCGIFMAKGPLSTSALQANLLICLYEAAQLLPHQAYLTLGTCAALVRAFGWLNEGFWSQERWISRARELKMCSILWWSMVFLER